MGAGEPAVAPNARSATQASFQWRRNAARKREHKGCVVMQYEIRATPTRIEAKASRRLSYDGGQDDAYRWELAGHIADLRVGNDEILHALYCGPDDPHAHRFDIENILFYNVRHPRGRGSSCFSRAARNGVSWAYKRQNECLTVYEAVPVSADHGREHLLIDQGDIPIDIVNSNTKPWHVWAWINEWQDQRKPESITWLRRSFAMEVTLGGVTGNFAALVKPVFDGIISTFHDNAAPSDLAGRIAAQTGRDETTVQRWVNRPGLIRISDKLPVCQRGDGVQWSPDDYLCVRGMIRPESGHSQVLRIRIWSTGETKLLQLH
jgi:hypothetical protein